MKSRVPELSRLLPLGARLRLATVLAVLAVPACGDASPGHAPLSGGSPEPAPTTGPVLADAGAPVCAAGHEGCPCDDVGATAECKIGPFRYGTIVECIVGTATCTDDGVWSRCVGSGTAVAQ